MKQLSESGSKRLLAVEFTGKVVKMSAKKKDLEIVYSLKWKNKPKREDKEMSIVAVYDIPATTLNFEVFKSYLLKNSGTSENDVRVSYIMDKGKEFPILSQSDFQAALFAFRRKARSGEIINLLLERISDQPVHKNLRHSNDVETQFDNIEPSSIVSTCCNIDSPPEWFLSSIAQLKKELTYEITAAVSSVVSSVVSSAVANVKPQLPPPPPPQPCHHHHSRKCKPEKRMRKVTPHTVEHNVDTKDLIKSMKLDHKLEKLERKTSKYREKRLALQTAVKSSDSEAGHSSSRSRSRDKNEKPKEEQEPKMDAKPVNSQSVVPHMLGGEVYLHQWEVQNTGEAPWTSKTQLHYTWGSKSLEPVDKVISVPPLKPGEKGTISVCLHIPGQSGKYECYWQFMHDRRRFGHWLGCQVVVDPFDLKGNRSVLATSNAPTNLDFKPENASAPTYGFIPDEAVALARFEEFLKGTNGDPAQRKSSDSSKSAEALASLYKSLQNDQKKDEDSVVKTITEELVCEVSENVDHISFDENEDSDTNSSDDENLSESLLAGYSSSKNSFKDEFVLVPVPQCFVVDGDPPAPSKGEGKVWRTQATTDLPRTSSTPKMSKAVSGGSFDDNNNESRASGSSGNSIKLRDEDLDNVVVITVPKDDQVKEGFIYVHVDGQKVLIPKNILKSEVVDAANALEKQPGESKPVGVVIESNESSSPKPTSSTASTIGADDAAGNTTDGAASTKTPSTSQPAKNEEKTSNSPIDMTVKGLGGSQNDLRSDYFEANNYTSHCSAAGSCFSEVNAQAQKQERRKLFVFPLEVPGYEVIYPTLNVNNPDNPILEEGTVARAPPSTGTSTPPATNPFSEMDHVPNYQQTLPIDIPVPENYVCTRIVEEVPSAPVEQPKDVPVQDENTTHARVVQQPSSAVENPAQVHILPETIVNGAVNVASSAINTARSVISHMINPQQAPGQWVNGHWVSNNTQSPREVNLQALAEMGFWNRDLNATLLARYDDDLNRVVAELVQ